MATDPEQRLLSFTAALDPRSDPAHANFGPQLALQNSREHALSAEGHRNPKTGSRPTRPGAPSVHPSGITIQKLNEN